MLQAASHSASSKNTQPWELAVVADGALDDLRKKLCEKFDNDIVEKPDYTYSPSPLPQLQLERARQCGYALFELKEIARDDHEKRKAHSRENFAFFGAPAALFLFTEAGAEKGTFLDLGLYLQSVMLGFDALGIGSCPQYSLTSYSKTIKDYLNIPEHKWFVCGLSIGYPDPENKVNGFKPEKMNLKDYVTWYT